MRPTSGSRLPLTEPGVACLSRQECHHRVLPDKTGLPVTPGNRQKASIFTKKDLPAGFPAGRTGIASIWVSDMPQCEFLIKAHQFPQNFGFHTKKRDTFCIFGEQNTGRKPLLTLYKCRIRFFNAKEFRSKNRI